MNRYQNTNVYKTTKGKRYYGTTKYPDIPLSLNDIYVYTTQGDKFDILAQQYYNDSSLWWIISSANSGLVQNSYYIPEGTQVRIPQNISQVLSLFTNLNER
jgi:phage tail protein X